VITLTSITISGAGQTLLTFTYDNPSGTVVIDLVDVQTRLRELQNLLSRPVTFKDAKYVIIKIINELRVGSLTLTAGFDYTPYMGVDLEA
jgi:hypothetical protein